MSASEVLDRLVRHTPDPRRVRFAMSGLLLLGVGVGLAGSVLPLWASELSLDANDAGRTFMGLALGSLAGVAAASIAVRRGGDRMRVIFCYSAWLAALGLIAASQLAEASALVYPVAVLGLGAGGLIRTTASALEACLTYQRAEGLLHLAGVSFGFGAAGVCLSAWALHRWTGTQPMLVAAAVLFGLVGWAARRGPVFAPRLDREATPARSGRRAVTPTGVLLGAGLLLQAANYGALGAWLGLYVFRKLGVTIDTSLAVLALFWIAVSAGRVAAARLPAEVGRMRLGAAVTMLAVLGAVFLLNTVDASGAVVGAVLLGAGAGAAHPLAVGAVTRRYALEHLEFTHVLTVASLLAGLGFAWLMGPLSAAWGIDVVVWTALICSLASLVALMLIVFEARLSQSPTKAR